MMKRSLTVLLLLSSSAAVAAGCGSSKKSSSTTAKGTSSSIAVTAAPSGPLPQPKESLSAFEKRMTAAFTAAAAGNCAPSKAFGDSVSYTVPCKPGKPAKTFANFKITGAATYGTGALIEYSDAEVTRPRQHLDLAGATPTVRRTTAFFPLALSPDGRYVYAGGPSGSPILAGPFIGTTPNGWSGADATAMAFLTSVQRNDCNTWFKNSITPNGMSKQQACSLGLVKFYAPLHKALTSGQPIKLYHLGGNAFTYFYGVRTGSQVRTLAVARDQPPAPPFVALTTVKAPAK